MKTTKLYIFLILLATSIGIAGCSNNDFDFSKDYDIPWKVSKITNVSPLTGEPGTSVVIEGENLGTDIVSSTGVTLGTEICEIVSQSDNSITIIVPSFASNEAVEVAVTNLHNRKYVFEENFIPIIH